MASITTAIPFNVNSFQCNPKCFQSRNCCNIAAINRISFVDIKLHNFNRLFFGSKFRARVIQHVLKPLSAVGSGLETSITDPNEKLVAFKNVKIVVESQEESKIQLRVDLTAEETEKVFSKVLVNLARSAPPIPGFKREKGGKTSKVPRDFLLQILGEDRVTNFVIQEILCSTVADYAKKENLNVKDGKVTTTQKAEELKKMFKPGAEFGFNAVLELEKAEAEPETEAKAKTETSS